MRAMIFAAGLGTRLQSITSNKPKALVEVAGKPLLEHAIDYLKKSGINEIVVNVHHYADQIIGFLQNKNNFDINIEISDERNLLLETGGGLKKAASFFHDDTPILLYNVDIFTNLDLNKLLDYHNHTKALATLVVRKRETSRYLLFDQQHQLTGWKNMKNEETKVCRPESFNQSEMYAFSGIHIVSPEIFSLITEEGKFSIIDLYLRLAKNYTIKAFVDDSDCWFDLGKADQFDETENMVKNYLLKGE